MKEDYEDIIHLPHHVSSTRAQMPRRNRAAQFMPFAALTGYEEAVQETARLTDQRLDLSEDARLVLDEKLRLLRDHAPERPEAVFLIFRPDRVKAGGSYVHVSATVRRVDDTAGEILLTDGRKIAVADLLDVTGDLFQLLDAPGC